MVDVSVVFGGDIRGLSSQTDAAKRSIQDAAKQISSSFDATNPAVERLQDSIDKLNASTERAASSAETLKSYANWAFALGAVKIAYSAVTGTIGLATGAVVLSGQAVVATGGLLVTGVRAWQSYAESMAYVAQYAPFVEMANYKTLASINILGHAIDNVTSFYGQMSLGIKDWLKSADIYKSGLLESAGVSIAAAGAMERFNKVSHEAGFENPTRALQAFTTQLTHIPGMTDQVAASIAASFAKIPTLTGPMNQFIVELTQKMSSSEDSAKNFAASLTKAMTDPASAGLNFLNTLGNIDGSLKEQFLTAQRQTDVGKMQASILDAMIQKYRQLAEDRTRGLREELEATGKIGIVGTTLQRSLQAQITEANEYNRLLEKQFAVLSNQANTLRSMVPTSEELSASMSGIVTAFNPLTNQLESVNAKMRVFNSTLKDSTGDAASLIAHFEAGAQGPALKAYFDKSDSGKKDAYAIGYGSHKMPDGSDVKPGDSITKEEAEQLLKDRTAEFAAIAAGQIGSTWNDLSTKVKASLTDLAYNYGSVPSSVVAAARSRDESGIADAIRSLKSDSKGNRRRRSEEADNIDKRELGGTPAEIETKRHVHDEQVRINQAIAGGNEIEKANLATLEKQISGKKDDVTAQKEVVAAIQRQLDLTESTNTRERLTVQLKNAQISLQDKLNALKKADLDKGVAKAENPAEILAAKKAVADFEMSLYAKNTTQYKAAEAAKAAAQKQFDDAGNAEELASESSKYAIALRALDTRKSLLQEEMNEGRITREQKRDGDLALEAERTAIERRHWETVRGLQNEGTAEYRASKNQLLQIDTEYAARRQKVLTADNRAIYQDYKRTFDQIGSSISGSIMGMLQGTQKFSDLLRGVATTIVQHFVQAGVKMVTDWAARTLMMTASTTAGEAAQTGAAAAGSAARTGIGAGEAAAGIATKGAAAVSSVLSSAAETFAGVFGFLSPVMGPAAAGPATASMTTVAAMAPMAAMDIGAYRVPHDQVAMVHRNELVMPAGPASALRDMLDGGGGRGTSVNPRISIPITTMDSRGVARVLSSNDGAVVKALSGAVARGAHLGLRGLKNR